MMNHSESIQRANKLKESVLILLITRQYKFRNNGFLDYCDLDKIITKDVDSSILSAIGVKVNGIPLASDVPLTVKSDAAESIMSNEQPKAQNAESSSKGESGDVTFANKGDPYKDAMLIRIVWKFKDPEPVAIEMHDPNYPDKRRTYHLRNGDMLHVPIAHAKKFIDRGIAVPVDVDIGATH